jgi:hypothetical protein
VIREIRPNPEPIEETDADGLDADATAAINVDDANNTPNIADISAAKIKDLEAKVRALQDQVREMSKNGAAAIPHPKRMANEANAVETDKMRSAKKTKTDNLGGHKVDSDNVFLSEPIKESPPRFGSNSSNPPFCFGTPAPVFGAARNRL